MHILIVNQHLSDLVGGSEIQCDIIARGLLNLGHEVTYLAFGGRQANYDSPYRVVPAAPEAGAFVAALKDHRPDVVYFRYNTKRLLNCAWQARRMGVPFVAGVSARTDVYPLALPWRRFVRRRGFARRARGAVRFGLDVFGAGLSRLALRMVDGVTCLNSDYLARIPNPHTLLLRDSLYFEEEPFEWPRPFVVWVASVKDSKNPDAFMDLACSLSGSQVDFLMAGAVQETKYEARLDAMAGVEGFHYLGGLSPAQVNGVLARSLFLVHTCDPEGFGNNFMQAWLYSRPTISLWFDPDSFISQHKLGFVSGSQAEFVANVQRLLRNPDERSSMGERARKVALAHFHPEENVARIQAFLHDIVANRSAKRAV